MTDGEVQDLRDRLVRLEAKVDCLAETVAKMAGSADTLNTIVKFVITPLLVILGGLIGIKLIGG